MRSAAEMVGGCCVCADVVGYEENPLVYCDGLGCDVAVHQGCYGILAVPDESWFCAKCAAEGKAAPGATCALCVNRTGALKKTSNGGWAHVICALYIPEVKFGDVHSMEPVITTDIPQERYLQVCYICEVNKGACMQCNRPNCKKHFHVTCAQHKGLLCEEGGDSKNVKYCGYCSHHYKKIQNEPGIKFIPAFRPHRKNGNQAGGSSSSSSASGTPDPRASSAGLLNNGGSNSSATAAPTTPAALDQLRNCVDTALGSNGPTTSSFAATAVTPGLLPAAAQPQPLLPPLPTPPLPTSTALPRPSAPPPPPLPSRPPPSSAGSETPGLGKKAEASVGTEGLPRTKSTSSRPPGHTPAKRGRPPGSTNANRAAALVDGEEKPKRPRKTTKKTVKSLLESVSHVVEDTVSSFQAERVESQRLQLEQQQQNATAAALLGLQAGTTQAPPVPSSSALMNPFGGPSTSSALLYGSPDATTALLAGPSSLNPGFAASLANEATSGLLGAFTSAPAASPLKPVARFGADAAALPASLEALLERQWEQGSAFLSEQSGHFDIASLLSCLQQLRSENGRLEKDIASLAGRKEHLLAVNARLSLSYASPQSPGQTSPLRGPGSALASPASSGKGGPLGSPAQRLPPQPSPALPSGFTSVGSGVGVFTSVASARGGQPPKSEASPDRPPTHFAVPRTPTPLMHNPVSLAALQQQYSNFTPEQLMMMQQHQLAAATYGNFSSLLPTTQAKPS